MQIIVGVLSFIIGVLTFFLPETLGEPLTSTLEEAEALGSKSNKRNSEEDGVQLSDSKVWKETMKPNEEHVMIFYCCDILKDYFYPGIFDLVFI